MIARQRPDRVAALSQGPFRTLQGGRHEFERGWLAEGTRLPSNLL